jgi:hypothetical protein
MPVKKIGDSVFWELINGIYYAVLYSKKLQDIKTNPNRSDEEMNEVNENILRKLSSYLLEGIVTLEKQETGNRIAYFALILSIGSIFLSMLSIILRFILHSFN